MPIGVMFAMGFETLVASRGDTAVFIAAVSQESGGENRPWIMALEFVDLLFCGRDAVDAVLKRHDGLGSR